MVTWAVAFNGDLMMDKSKINFIIANTIARNADRILFYVPKWPKNLPHLSNKFYRALTVSTAKIKPMLFPRAS